MKNIFIALLSGLSAIAYSQTTLSGNVKDESQLPVMGVLVSVPEIQKETTTDANGRYEFKNLPKSDLQLIFSRLGYTTQIANVTISENTIFDIVIEQTSHVMDEVIVSTPFNRLQSENVVKVEHVNIESLRHHGVQTLVEGVDAIPGVSQISTGTSIGKPVIRGLSGNRVLVYSQGIRLENQQFGDEHGLGLSDSGVESVEIIKGPASLLYGSDAMGGVLYFNPEKFAPAKSIKADFNTRFFANTLGTSTSAGVRGSSENWKFLARAGYASHADYSIPGGDRVTNSRYNETDIKTGIGYANAAYSGTLRYNYNRLDTGIPEDISAQTENHTPDYPKQAVDNHILSFQNTFFLNRSKLTSVFGYTLNNRSEFEDSSVAALQMKLATFSYDLKYHFPAFGKFEFVAGTQGMHQRNENSGEELLIPDAITNDNGIFGMLNYQWKSNVIQAGLRYDNRAISTETHGTESEEGYFEAIDRSFNSVNASLGYKGNVSKSTVLRFNVASGFRAPNLAELTSNGVHEGTNRYEIGNGRLKSEQNVQSDINIEYTTTHFDFYVNGFYNLIDDYIYAAPTGSIIDGHDVYRYTSDNAYLYGGEAGIHLHPHPLDWLHFESSVESITGKKDNGAYLPLIPAMNWDNTLRGEFKISDWLTDGFARLNVSATLPQKNTDLNESSSDGYTLVNAGVGGKFKIGNIVLNANLNVNNIFDTTYVAHLSRLKPDGIPNIGRNIVVGIRFQG